MQKKLCSSPILLIVPNYTLKPARLIRTEHLTAMLVINLDTGLEINQGTINFRRKRV